MPLTSFVANVSSLGACCYSRVVFAFTFFPHLFKFSFVGVEMLLRAFVVSHDEMSLSCILLVPSHYNLLTVLLRRVTSFRTEGVLQYRCRITLNNSPRFLKLSVAYGPCHSPDLCKTTCWLLKTVAVKDPQRRSN